MPSFQTVLSNCGQRPSLDAGQNATRHYSETFSREAALWLHNSLVSKQIGSKVLPPEGKVDTIYGNGNRGKSLDVATVDHRGYLLLNISIKSFHFKDKKTGNYRKNYTGRFYELLGEAFDVCKSYKHAIMCALIILPNDSTSDSDPSSFALAAKQFGKVLRPSKTYQLGFDFVFIGLYDAKGIVFFDASTAPPAFNFPKPKMLLNASGLIRKLESSQQNEALSASLDTMPKTINFKFS